MRNSILYQDGDCNRFVKRIRRERDQLFTFLESTAKYHNNSSEQGLRGFALSRKVTYGNRSWKGIETTETIATIYETCRVRKVNFRDFVTQYMAGTIKEIPKPLPAMQVVSC